MKFAGTMKNYLLRRFSFSGFIALLLTSCHFQEQAPLPGYKLVWADEFEGSKLDEANWVYRTDSKHWSTQKSRNVKVSNGVLRLELKKEKAKKKSYTGAGVISKRLFKYGYYEARLRIPGGAGWHTAFWLMKYDGSGGTGEKVAKQEIVVFEQDSIDPMKYTTALHNWEGEHRMYGYKEVKTDNLNTNFHVWGGEFTEKHIRYYFDGRLIQELKGTLLNHNEQNIWLTSIAAPLGGTKSVDDSKLPDEAVFDYVRFYEKE